MLMLDYRNQVEFNWIITYYYYYYTIFSAGRLNSAGSNAGVPLKNSVSSNMCSRHVQNPVHKSVHKLIDLCARWKADITPGELKSWNISPVGERDFESRETVSISQSRHWHSCDNNVPQTKPLLLIYLSCPAVAWWLFLEKVNVSDVRANTPLLQLFFTAAKLSCSSFT